MKIMNATGYDVECLVHEKTYKFGPFEEMELYEDSAARILCKTYAHCGIVHLAYTDDLQKKYPEYEDFKTTQKLNGLKSFYTTMTQARINEMQAIRDVKEKSGAEADRVLMNPEKFEKKVKQTQKWIDELEGKASGGRKPKKNESGNNKNSGASAD